MSDITPTPAEGTEPVAPAADQSGAQSPAEFPVFAGIFPPVDLGRSTTEDPSEAPQGTPGAADDAAPAPEEPELAEVAPELPATPIAQETTVAPLDLPATVPVPVHGQGEQVTQDLPIEQPNVIDKSLTPVVETAVEPATPGLPEASAPTAPVVEAPAAAAPKPRPMPSPSALAGRKPVVPAAPVAPVPVANSESVKFGRVAEDGTVFVTTPDGEREVGSYPGSTPDEALAYFARKYDDHAAAANLLLHRTQHTDLSSHEALDSLRKLREQIGEANVVGDLPALDATLSEIDQLARDKARHEQEARNVAREEARGRRELLVAEAEKIAATPAERIQWKNSGARMRELLDEWKAAQKAGPKLDKESESALWERFSKARNSFDRGRKAFFAELDEQHASAKTTKQKLVAEAEALATSTDWGATAGEFRRLMDRWRSAGRADRATDDSLWEKFKSAQDRFFRAKDEVVAAENAEFTENLKVKEALIVEAQALLPITDIEATKDKLRNIQERWESAGKVPRADIGRVEGAMRRVEQAVRDAEDAKWKATNPEVAARARSLVEQLEGAVERAQKELDKAQAAGNAKKVADLTKELDAKKAWLDQARAGLAEFGG